jgi:hypothetical protein
VENLQSVKMEIESLLVLRGILEKPYQAVGTLGRLITLWQFLISEEKSATTFREPYAVNSRTYGSGADCYATSQDECRNRAYFNIEIPDETAEKISNLQQAVDFITQKVTA